MSVRASDPGDGASEIEEWFLRAVIRVYGPWVTSDVVNAEERRLAARRVTHARRTLAELDSGADSVRAALPRGRSGAWGAGR
ncbi:hypothetical protein HNR21_003354 [Actinomadura cellulosilytica]|uniref:Uncharacterized protein n=1 Tax=Thermomonospora cellulosilytica TaxID=1411118 RepID=A0A7W3R982_9ACTN|nr:hypothetical protein [Thermomonospora cellulosilytica]